MKTRIRKRTTRTSAAPYFFGAMKAAETNSKAKKRVPSKLPTSKAELDRVLDKKEQRS